MSVQTTYAQTPAIAFNGMIAQQFSLRQIDSGLVETAAIGLGVAMKLGTGLDQYVAAAADDAVTGASVFATQDVESQTSFEYAVEASFPLMVKGRYWATANAALSKNAVVAYDPATGKVGAVSGGVTTLAFAKVITAAAADGDLVLVEVNF